MVAICIPNVDKPENIMYTGGVAHSLVQHVSILLNY